MRLDFFAHGTILARQFKPLGEPSRALASSSRLSVGGVQSAADRLKSIRALNKKFPELQPAASLFPGLGHLSEAINQYTYGHDPTITELLAWGQISHINDSHDRVPVPLIAVAGGIAGEAVRLILMRREQLGWKGDKSLYLENFSAKDGEECLWSGQNSPVQQIVVAGLEEQSSSSLAVRYHETVTILRPQFRRHNLISTSNCFNIFQSRLDPNPILTISIEEIDDVPFADITFSPWNHQEIATINQNGHWIIWGIRGVAPQRGLWTTEKIFEGNLGSGHQPEDQHNSSGDGWAMVLWAGDVNKIVAANRKDFAVFDLSRNAMRLDVPNFLSRNPSDSILDVKKNPQDNNRLFLLTSSTIFWISVPTSMDDNGHGAQCLLSWRHFIDQEDISLRLHVLHESRTLENMPDTAGTDLKVVFLTESANFECHVVNTVLLYSRLSGLTIVFTFQYIISSTDHAISASDPFLLPIMTWEIEDSGPLAAHGALNSRKPSITNLAIRPVSFDIKPKTTTSDLGRLCSEGEVRFYHISALTHDLSLVECLYTETATGSELTIDRPSTFSRRHFAAKTPKRVPDDFIVPDGHENSDLEGSLEEADFEWPGKREQEPLSRSAVSNKEAWTIDFGWLDNGLRRTLSESSAKETESFNDVLQHIRITIKASGTADDSVIQNLYVRHAHRCLLSFPLDTNHFFQTRIGKAQCLYK